MFLFEQRIVSMQSSSFGEAFKHSFLIPYLNLDFFSSSGLKHRLSCLT